jgi:hypothetical protein
MYLSFDDSIISFWRGFIHDAILKNPHLQKYTIRKRKDKSMNQTKTVERRVLDILKSCPMARYDDMVLILHYYNRYSRGLAGKLPFENVALQYRKYGLPCFETIRRARQRVQALFPELSRNTPETDDEAILCLVVMEEQ